MMEAPYLCVLYVATAGQQGPGLGADEEEIVLLVYVVIDMGQNKVNITYIIIIVYFVPFFTHRWLVSEFF